MAQETIYALSTALGKSGVAVVRVSGKFAFDVFKKMTNLDLQKILPRKAYLSKLYGVQSKELLDNVLLIYFKAPHSFTGEDVVEIHAHGSKAVLNSILENLALIDSFRLAEAGEFSKRAFYNQKMDLTEAEGLADLIDAETYFQQKQALKQLSGNLRVLYSNWRAKLLEILAHLEAYIDFPDENIPDRAVSEILQGVSNLKAEIEGHLRSSRAGERLREGFRVVLTGAVNAGKSSLLNAIIERQAVIVSDVAGTTRDAVDVYLDISGYPVILTDTAGLRQAQDEIEKQGIEISKQKISDADLVLAVFDASIDTPDCVLRTLSKHKNKTFLVANKADKLRRERCSELLKENCIVLSAKTKEGLPLLFSKIKNFLEQNISTPENAVITRARYRESLSECVKNLSNFNLNKEIELSAEDIRLAARAIGKITGEIEVGEILDKIFSSFCIGK